MAIDLFPDLETQIRIAEALENLNVSSGDLSNYIKNEDIKEVVNGVSYNTTNHKITFSRYDEADIVIDLPIESLLVGLSLDGDDLVLELEDGTTTRVPLNTLLIGVVKEVNGKTPNSSGVVSLNYSDLNNLPSIPENTSDLINDSDFATTDYVDDTIGDIETILNSILGV